MELDPVVQHELNVTVEVLSRGVDFCLEATANGLEVHRPRSLGPVVGQAQREGVDWGEEEVRVRVGLELEEEVVAADELVGEVRQLALEPVVLAVFFHVGGKGQETDACP